VVIVEVMAKKRDNEKIGISMRFTPIQYYQLKKMADIHNRGMNDEVISLIEKVAANMRMQLDREDEAVQTYIQNESERLGISPEETAERVTKRYYERQRILQDGTKYLETLEQEEKGTGTTGRS
jgi:hypothetical protein